MIYYINIRGDLPYGRKLCRGRYITPSEFFSSDESDPVLVHKAAEGLRQLDDSDLLMVLNLIDRLLKKS